MLTKFSTNFQRQRGYKVQEAQKTMIWISYPTPVSSLTSVRGRTWISKTKPQSRTLNPTLTFPSILYSILSSCPCEVRVSFSFCGGFSNPLTDGLQPARTHGRPSGFSLRGGAGGGGGARLQREAPRVASLVAASQTIWKTSLLASLRGCLWVPQDMKVINGISQFLHKIHIIVHSQIPMNCDSF